LAGGAVLAAALPLGTNVAAGRPAGVAPEEAAGLSFPFIFDAGAIRTFSGFPPAAVFSFAGALGFGTGANGTFSGFAPAATFFFADGLVSGTGAGRTFSRFPLPAAFSFFGPLAFGAGAASFFGGFFFTGALASGVASLSAISKPKIAPRSPPAMTRLLDAGFFATPSPSPARDTSSL
jgi:hypothetical protein